LLVAVAASALGAAVWVFVAAPRLPAQVESLGFGLTVLAAVALLLSGNAWVPRVVACLSPPPTTIPTLSVQLSSSVTPAWHTMTHGELAASLQLGSAERVPAGLATNEEAAARLVRYGRNALPPPRPPNLLLYILKEVHEPQQVLLLGVAVAYALIGEVDEAAFALVVICLMIGAEAVTELRAKRALAALATTTPAFASALRGGSELVVDRTTLVPGDVVVLRRGNDVPADAVLLTAHGLACEEAAFTGESVAQAKAAGGGDRHTVMVFRGTRVVAGRGTALVVATGVASWEGQLHASIAAARDKQGKTPLQGLLKSLAGKLTVVALVASVVGGALGFAHSAPWQDVVLTALSLAFATIPEELPILVTAVLAVGGMHLGRRGVYVKRLRAMESLAYVDTVVADKTGTLTANRLRLAAVWTPPPTDGVHSGEPFAPAAALGSCSPGDVGDIPALVAAAWAATCVDLPTSAPREPAAVGPPPSDPMDAAVAAALRDSATAVLANLLAAATPVAEEPFSPTTKIASREFTVAAAAGAGARFVVYRGAPEVLLQAASGVVAAGGVLDASPAARAAAAAAVSQHAAAGRRCVALAVGAPRGPSAVVGILAFEDPIATGVDAAVSALAGAGIAVVLCTGDHPATARAVAGALHLPLLNGGAGDEGGDVVDCSAHARGSGGGGDAWVADCVAAGSRVFARATPADKLALVAALQASGRVVAVTGDGTNDAPALARADIGVAVPRATDVARDAAALVIVAGDFGAVVTAVAEGRRLAANLMAALAFYLGCKAGLVLLFVAGTAWRGFPLAAPQVIFAELFMDVAASTAFVAEPAAAGVLRQAPRRRSDPPFGTAFWAVVAAGGVSMAAGVLGSYGAVGGVLGGDLPTATSAAFYAWMIGHVVLALNMRPACAYNPFMAAWVVAVAAAVLLFAFTPAVATSLQLTHLSAAQWGATAAIAVGCTSWLAPARAVAAALQQGFCHRVPPAHGGGSGSTAPLLPPASTPM